MLLKRAQEVANKIGKEVDGIDIIQAGRADFNSYYDAVYKLERNGCSVDKMIKNDPIKFYKNSKLSGAIITNLTYKDGEVAIVYFK